jgi:hypothetical protein
MALDPVGIFRQLGFSDADGCLARTFSGAAGASVLEVRDAATGGMPVSSSGSFDVRVVNPDLPPGWRGALHIELRDAVLADAVALVVGDANFLVVGEGGWPRDELAFADDGTTYFNAYCDTQYGDWCGDMEEGTRILVLRDPQETYGDLHLGWRASLMDLAARGELGPMLEAAPAPRPA